jgi:hypothetical protein
MGGSGGGGEPKVTEHNSLAGIEQRGDSIAAISWAFAWGGAFADEVIAVDLASVNVVRQGHLFVLVCESVRGASPWQWQQDFFAIGLVGAVDGFSQQASSQQQPSLPTRALRQKTFTFPFGQRQSMRGILATSVINAVTPAAPI